MDIVAAEDVSVDVKDVRVRRLFDKLTYVEVSSSLVPYLSPEEYKRFLEEYKLKEIQHSERIFSQKFQFSGKYGGAFIIVATAKPEISAEELSFEIREELKKFVNGNITEDELERVRNSHKSMFIYTLQNIATLADQLNHYNFYLNEPNYFGKEIEHIDSVTIHSLRDAAQKYLTGNFVELKILQEGK